MNEFFINQQSTCSFVLFCFFKKQHRVQTMSLSYYYYYYYYYYRRMNETKKQTKNMCQSTMADEAKLPTDDVSKTLPLCSTSVTV